jgi:hypothetical protein
MVITWAPAGGRDPTCRIETREYGEKETHQGANVVSNTMVLVLGGTVSSLAD